MDSLRVVLVLLVRLQTPGCEGHIAKRIKIVGQPRTHTLIEMRSRVCPRKDFGPMMRLPW